MEGCWDSLDGSVEGGQYQRTWRQDNRGPRNSVGRRGLMRGEWAGY